MGKVIKQRPELQWFEVHGRATINLCFDREKLISWGYKPDTMTEKEMIRAAIAHGSWNVMPDVDGYGVVTDYKAPPKLVDSTRR